MEDTSGLSYLYLLHIPGRVFDFHPRTPTKVLDQKADHKVEEFLFWVGVYLIILSPEKN
jgi:hypothetical protein